MNVLDYFKLLEIDFKEVIEIVECWYELKLEEIAKLEGKKPENKTSMSYEDMLKLGFKPDDLNEGLNDY